MQLAPATGTLTARIFGNVSINLSPTLFFDIEVPIAPFAYRSVTQNTKARFEFIELPVNDWREIVDREFTFPVNPEPGYIDGSIYLMHVHNPVDATRIRFGRMSTNVIPVSLEVVADFTYEGPAELGRVPLFWQTDLQFDQAALDQVFENARRDGIL